jgi:hypothetical protein
MLWIDLPNLGYADSKAMCQVPSQGSFVGLTLVPSGKHPFESYQGVHQNHLQADCRRHIFLLGNVCSAQSSSGFVSTIHEPLLEWDRQG